MLLLPLLLLLLLTAVRTSIGIGIGVVVRVDSIHPFLLQRLMLPLLCCSQPAMTLVFGSSVLCFLWRAFADKEGKEVRSNKARRLVCAEGSGFVFLHSAQISSNRGGVGSS